MTSVRESLAAGNVFAQTAVSLAWQLRSEVEERGAALLGLRQPDAGAEHELHATLAALPTAEAMLESWGWRLQVRDLNPPDGVAFVRGYAVVEVPTGFDVSVWPEDVR